MHNSMKTLIWTKSTKYSFSAASRKANKYAFSHGNMHNSGKFWNHQKCIVPWKPWLGRNQRNMHQQGFDVAYCSSMLLPRHPVPGHPATPQAAARLFDGCGSLTTSALPFLGHPPVDCQWFMLMSPRSTIPVSMRCRKCFVDKLHATEPGSDR